MGIQLYSPTTPTLPILALEQVLHVRLTVSTFGGHSRESEVITEDILSSEVVVLEVSAVGKVKFRFAADCQAIDDVGA